MLSKIPADIKSVPEGDIDKEIIRAAIVAEIDAINLCEQIANLTKNTYINPVLTDVAKEKKTRIGEFQAFSLQFDPQHKKEVEAGARDAEEALSKYCQNNFSDSSLFTDIFNLFLRVFLR